MAVMMVKVCDSDGGGRGCYSSDGGKEIQLKKGFKDFAEVKNIHKCQN